MMKGFRVWGLANSRILAFFFVLFLTIYHIPYTLYPTLATDSTPSADIAAKLKEFQKAAASKAAQLKELINKKLQNKAFIGNVQVISGNSLTLSLRSGPKIVSLNQDTVFESTVKSKQKYSQKVISEGDYVVALGDLDETGVLTAKKIILLNPIPQTQNPKTYLWGQIISISEELTTLRDKDLKNVAASLPAVPKTRLNDLVILTGSMDKNKIFKAEFVYILPQHGVIKPRKTATPSAKIASPSGKSSSTK